MTKINKFIKFVLVVVSFIIGIINLKRGIYVDVLIDICILPTLLVPEIFRKFNIKIDNNFEFIYILFIFFAYFLGTVIDLYTYIEHYDTLMHFLSGVFEAYIAIKLLKNNYNSKLNNIFFILGFVSLISVGWEIFEFISSIVFKVDPQKVETTGIVDTMKDLIVALIGGILVIVDYKRK